MSKTSKHKMASVIENIISLLYSNLDSLGCQATLIYVIIQGPRFLPSHRFTTSLSVASFDWLKLFSHYAAGHEKWEKSMHIDLKLRYTFFLLTSGLNHMSCLATEGAGKCSF